MTDRVDLLEERVAALASAVERLEARLASLGSPEGLVAKGCEEWTDGVAPEIRPDAAPVPAEAVGSLPADLAGRAFPGIGGARPLRSRLR